MHTIGSTRITLVCARAPIIVTPRDSAAGFPRHPPHLPPAAFRRRQLRAARTRRRLPTIGAGRSAGGERFDLAGAFSADAFPAGVFAARVARAFSPASVAGWAVAAPFVFVFFAPVSYGAAAGAPRAARASASSPMTFPRRTCCSRSDSGRESQLLKNSGRRRRPATRATRAARPAGSTRRPPPPSPSSWDRSPPRPAQNRPE